MKKNLFTLMALALVVMVASCNKDEESATPKSPYEIGNTGKVVSTMNELCYSDGSPNTLVQNITLHYAGDFSKINSLDYSEGILDRLMKDYFFTIEGNTIVDGDGAIAYSDIKLNDKGRIVHLEDYTQPNRSRGITHTTFDIQYNSEDRMTQAKFTAIDTTGGIVYTWIYDLLWKGGLLQSIHAQHNGEAYSAISFTYGSQPNVFCQPTYAALDNLNMVSINGMRAFVAAGYFGKGSDKFMVSSTQVHFEDSETLENTYSVELDSEGKISALHKEYQDGRHYDMTFTYSDIK